MIVPIAIILALVIICVFLCKNIKHQKVKVQIDQEGTTEKGEKTQQSSTVTMDVGKSQGKGKKKKKKEQAMTSLPAKTNKELQEMYGDWFYGNISLRNSKQLTTVTSLAIKHSKVLLGNSKNELVLYDLRKWKSHTACSQHYYTSLGNNCATAVAISPHFYFACLDFEKTIVYFQFKGEGGVYFKEVKKFNRNIFKGNQGSMHVPQS